MIAANMMTTGVRTLTPGSTLLEALRLSAGMQGEIPVVGEDNKILGVITWRALLKEVLPARGPARDHLSSPESGAEGLSRPIDNFIDKRYSSVSPHARLTEIAAMFIEGVESNCVLVVDDHERLLGMISPGDLFKRLWEYLE